MEENTAFDIIKNTLRFYGLDDAALFTEVETLVRNEVIVPGMGIDQIGIQLRDTTAFKNRFPANEALATAGKPQLSVSEYLRLESDYKSRMQNAGLPSGFYDSPQDFQNFIANDVSPDEIQARIDLGYQAVRQANPAVINEFKRLYGVSEGDLAAYFIDPTRAKPTFDRFEAQRQAQAAQIAAQASGQAQMALTAQEAESLARSGISEETARAGFGAIAEQQGLFQAQMAGEQAVSREEQIGGTFGTNAQARQAIQRRRRARQAAFETGGGLAGMGTTSQATGLTTVGE